MKSMADLNQNRRKTLKRTNSYELKFSQSNNEKLKPKKRKSNSLYKERQETLFTNLFSLNKTQNEAYISSSRTQFLPEENLKILFLLKLEATRIF